MGVTQNTNGSIRISDDLVLVQGQRGQWFAHAMDDGLPGEIARTGLWSPEDVAAFHAHVRPGEHVLDLGGHIGHHTVVLSQLVGAAGRVTVVEARAEIVRLLKMNVLLNRCDNVSIVHAAVDDTRGKASLYWTDYTTPANLGSMPILPTPAEGCESVDLMPIDDMNLPRLDFIKCDVQGAEVGAILGARRTIERYKPTIYCEIGPKSCANLNRDFEDIFRFLYGLGYTATHTITPDAAGIPRVDVESYAEWMSLFIHPSRSTQ